MQKAKNWLTLLFLGSGLIFFWLGSARYLSQVLSQKPHPKALPPTMSDLATIFFGASSLALIVFSLLLAAAAIIEWQSLKSDVRKVTEAAEASLERVKNLEEKLRGRVEALEKELRGRVDAVMGAMIGTLNSKPDSDTQSEDHKYYIAEAIHYTKRGYDRLKELEGNGKYMALNSLVYFTCLLGDRANRDEMLQQGRELRDVGRKYDHLPYAAPYLMTFCRVAWVYGSDRNEVEQALAVAQNLLKTRLTSLQEREAKYLVASLSKKLVRIPAPTN